MPTRMVPPATRSRVPSGSRGISHPARRAERVNATSASLIRCLLTLRRCPPSRALQPLEQDGPLHLLDGLRDLDAARTGFRAVERGPAPEHAGLVGQNPEALLGSVIPRIEDETVSVHDGGRP